MYDNDFYTVQEIRNRLSISTIVFRELKPISESSMEELVKNGIRKIELLETPDQYDMTSNRSMRHVSQICRNSGVEIDAYHAHKTTLSGLETEKKRRSIVDTCKRQIDTLLELGGTIWGCHTRSTDDGNVRKSYEELLRSVEGTDAIITVENFNTDEGVFVHDRVSFLDEINHPQMGMILDIGHVLDENNENPMTYPGGPTYVVGLCSHLLRHVHLHGFTDTDHWPPMCEGDGIQWLELFRALKSSDYSGCFNFEPFGEPTHLGSVEATGVFPEKIVEIAGNS